MTSEQPQNSGYEISAPTQLPPSPTVSVLMLAYNHEPYVRQALDSILAQEVDFPYEIVIGEDCSTDRTREILMEYQSLRPDLFRIITSDANVGMSKNFMRTSEACRGKYIAICEGDDFWTENKKLVIQHGILESRPDVSFVVHNATVLRLDDTEYLMNALGRDQDFSLPHILGPSGQYFATASYFMRREVVDVLPTWIAIAPVIDFFLEVYSQKVGIGHFISKPMSSYRARVPGGWTQTTFSSHHASARVKSRLISCHEAMLHDFPEHGGMIRARLLHLARSYFLSAAACGSPEFSAAVASTSRNILPIWESWIALLGPDVFRKYSRVRDRMKRIGSALV